MLSLFGVPAPNGPAGAGAGPALGAGPRSGWPRWSYEGAHEAITLGERHRGKRGVLSAPSGRGAWKAFPSKGGSRRPLPPNCPAHSGRGGEVEGRPSSALFRPVPEPRGRHLAPWRRQGRKRRGMTRALQAEPRSGTGWGREPMMAAVSLGRRAMMWAPRRRRRGPSGRRRRRGLAFRSSGHRLGKGVAFSSGRLSCLAFKAERASAGTRWDAGSFLGVGIPPAPEGEALPLGRRGGACSRGG
jgi:hypothetical protein